MVARELIEEGYCVDIGTEWNLKAGKGIEVWHMMGVDIGTEWNLKVFIQVGTGPVL